MKRLLVCFFLIFSLTLLFASCDSEAPGSGESEAPGNGESEAPGSGESEAPGSGESEAPGSGESEAPGSGESETPGSGESEAPATTKYTVIWADEKGNTLATQNVEEGCQPAYTYTVTDTAEWDYTFIGWSKSVGGDTLSAIPAATENATYYAKVSAVKQKYTVTFNTGDGSAVPSQTVEYGAYATIPEKPTLEGYKFSGWCTTSDGSTPADFEKPITGNTNFFAVWNKVANIKEMLSSLLGGYKLNPFSYIPESMLYGYSENLVDPDDIVTDYSSFVNVSDITYGFGEQWHMVLDNLRQSQTFFSVLNTVDSIASASITVFNNYFDSNPADTAHHEFASGIYSVTVDYDGEILYYVLDYTADIPLLGTQTVQIALAMISETGEKTVRIQIGDANALTYTVLENSYEFAIKYLGARRAMFAISKDKNGNVSGHIYEYLGVASAQIASAADFYITEDYVSVVGNKASGLLGFTGTISELYDTDSGKMLGYEIEETLSKITYNTLWFNLEDILGINSIKYREATDSTDAALFINGLTKEWKTKNVGILDFSRRYDIEFRTQYVYSYDEVNEAYVEYEISVPMLFVQEEVYDDLTEDVEDKNDVTISVSISNSDLQKLLSDYDTLLEIFKTNKENVTADLIVAYIGEKISFTN